MKLTTIDNISESVTGLSRWYSSSYTQAIIHIQFAFSNQTRSFFRFTTPTQSDSSMEQIYDSTIVVKRSLKEQHSRNTGVSYGVENSCQVHKRGVCPQKWMGGLNCQAYPRITHYCWIIQSGNNFQVSASPFRITRTKAVPHRSEFQLSFFWLIINLMIDEVVLMTDPAE